MNLDYYRGTSMSMPRRTVWCVEFIDVKDEDKQTLGRRIFSNRDKAVEWIDKVRADEGLWAGCGGCNCFQLPFDWIEIPKE